jgi:ferredoxin-NADP reductase
LVFEDSALPATATAIHVALAVLRRHRAGGTAFSPFVLPSFLLAATPWLWPSARGLASTLALHAIWLIVCEFVAPARTTRPPARTISHPAHSSRTNHTPTNPVASPTLSFVTTPVLAVLAETPEIKTFRLARPERFDFVPGQFVTVRVRIDDRPHVRCYSISSSPDARGYLEISVRKQGLVSGALHALLQPGSQVTIGRPAGRFTYPGGDDRPVALIAGGIGITPLLSMLRFALSSDPARPISLLYSVRRACDVAFASELRAIAERHPQVRIAITQTQPEGPTRFRTGRIDAAMLRQYLRDPALTICCVCGPAPMIGEIKTTLASMGVPASQVRVEEFETAVAASALQAPDARTPVAGRDRSHCVTFAASGRAARVSSSVTLLEAAEAEGVPMMFSCRSGVCQSCRTRVVEGRVDCRSDVLDPADRDAGFVLPCVSWAVSDCTLEA